MGVPRRWTVYDCPSGCVFVRHDRIGPQSCPFCDAHPVCDPVEVVEVQAALPDDQLREKVAEAIRRVNMDGPELSRRLADAAIEAMRGVSAAPAPITEGSDPEAFKAAFDHARAAAPAPPEQEAWLTEDYVAEVMRETFWECEREPRTNFWLAFWDRLTEGSGPIPDPPDIQVYALASARGFTDEDVERAAKALASFVEGQPDWPPDERDREAVRAVLAAVGPKETKEAQ